MTHRLRVLVFGAGNIGCYVGGLLAGAGAQVTLLGRPRIADDIARHGLRLTDLDGALVELSGSQIPVITTPDQVPDEVDMVLVTVKSAATAEAADTLAALLRPGTLIISLQNGIGNDEVLRARLPTCVTTAGLVVFNVSAPEPGHFHRGTDGGIAVADVPELDRTDAAAMFAAVGLPLRRHQDLRPVQWAKLLLNLNNPINALSGRPLLDELGRRGYRRCLAAAQREALDVLAAANIRPARLTALPPRATARLLGAPDALFRAVAGRLLAVDPHARSSMADDLALGRRTEVDWLCGEVTRLGERHGVATPVNRRLAQLVHAAENGGRDEWSAVDLLAEVTAAVSPEPDR